MLIDQNMLIYGTKCVPVKVVDVTVECPACKMTCPTTLHILSEHVHIFWIPFIPTDKIAVSRCSNCKQGYTTKHISNFQLFDERTGRPVLLIMPLEISRFFYAVKGKIWPRWWQFLGVSLVIAAILYYSIVVAHNADKHTENYFTAPKVGDVYQARMNDKVYTTFKLQKITRDSVYVLFNTHIVDDKVGFYKLEHQPFETNVTVMPKTFLNDLKMEDKIYRIIRK